MVYKKRVQRTPQHLSRTLMMLLITGKRTGEGREEGTEGRDEWELGRKEMM